MARLLLVVTAAAVLAGGGPAAPPLTLIRGATVIDISGAAPLRDAVILIEAERISRVGRAADVPVPAAADVLEAHGRYIIPGLVDTHNHLGTGVPGLGLPQDRVLAGLLGWGVTTVFNPSMTLGGFEKLKPLSEGIAPYPALFAVGPAFTAKGGHGDFFPGASLNPATPDEVRRDVRRLKEAGVDAIKVIYDDMAQSRPALPMLSRPVMEALVEESHRQGLKVYAHARALEEAKEFLRAGGDGLVHTVSSAPVDDEFVALMKKNGASYTATLSLYHAIADVKAWARRLAAFDRRGNHPRELYARFEEPEALQEAAGRYGPFAPAFIQRQLPLLRANTRRMQDEGILVVAGTDTGVPGVVFGVSSQMELVLLVETGLTPLQALQAATINAARLLGREEDVGTVQAGRRADLLILDADPLADIRNVHLIHRVVRSGVVHEPGDLLASNAR